MTQAGGVGKEAKNVCFVIKNFNMGTNRADSFSSDFTSLPLQECISDLCYCRANFTGDD